MLVKNYVPVFQHNHFQVINNFQSRIGNGRVVLL